MGIRPSDSVVTIGHTQSSDTTHEWHPGGTSDGGIGVSTERKNSISSNGHSVTETGHTGPDGKSHGTTLSDKGPKSLGDQLKDKDRRSTDLGERKETLSSTGSFFSDGRTWSAGDYTTKGSYSYLDGSVKWGASMGQDENGHFTAGTGLSAQGTVLSGGISTSSPTYAVPGSSVGVGYSAGASGYVGGSAGVKAEFGNGGVNASAGAFAGAQGNLSGSVGLRNGDDNLVEGNIKIGGMVGVGLGGGIEADSHHFRIKFYAAAGLGLNVEFGLGYDVPAIGSAAVNAYYGSSGSTGAEG